MNYFATQSTPIGPFTSIVDSDGSVFASGWTDDAESLRALVHPHAAAYDLATPQ